MKPHWSRVNDLFHRALDLPPADREAFLDQACAGDEALRREVASLIDASARATGFIEQPAAASLPPVDDGAAGALVGRTIGHYQIQRVLGKGGMGVVYLADDTRLGRLVALKALAPTFTRDAVRRERLVREARAAAGLLHPGIATVFALEEFDGDLFIACEYIPGETLRTELQRGPLSPLRVLETARQLARALAAAHARGIVHRDLKPENIIRTPAGTLKILDFGLARFADAGAADGLTGGGVLGTPAYMSPEQIRGRPVDARSDLFSLGVLLYELTTGAHPFARHDAAATIACILEHEPPPLTSAVPDDAAHVVRDWIEPPVLTCLRKPADARFRSTTELVAVLDAAHPAPAPGASSPAGAAAGPAGGSGAATSAPGDPGFIAAVVGSRGPRWWWGFHQAAASAAYLVLLVPLWFIRGWLPGGSGRALFIASVIAALVASTLRLHHLFAVRSYPDEWARERPHTSRWIRFADLAFGALLLGAGGAILGTHDSAAALLVATAVGVLVSALVIEPATTRAAFPADRGTP